MPPAGRPRSSSLDRETRQQLDELDALMQRMLALPVDPPDSLVDPPIQPPAGDTPAEGTSAYSEASPATAAALVPEPAIPVQVEQPSPLQIEDCRLQNEEQAVRSAICNLQSAICVDPRRGAHGEGVVDRGSAENARARRLTWPMYPLLWINWPFDRATGLLGPLGRWLRGPRGRALLGWGGLVLLAAALAWLAWDGLGWTW